MANLNDLTIGVIVPTFRRELLLSRFLRRMKQQRHKNWRLMVAHDGPGPATSRLISSYQKDDPRFEYFESESRANDFGITPRLEGARLLVARGKVDYCVFWDDDNLYSKNALSSVAGWLSTHDQPDLLLVGMRYQNKVLPPKNVPIAEISTGMIDTGSLVSRPGLAIDAFAHVQRFNHGLESIASYTGDFQFLDWVRDQEPTPTIAAADGIVMGVHDGLRWKPYIRNLLGIPPLGIFGR